MDREKVLELAREADLYMTSDERIAAVERFAALIEREVRGDAEPIGFDVFTEDGRVKFRVGNQYFTLEYNSEDKDELRFMQNMLVSALGRLSSCPAPAVDAEPALSEWLDKTEWVQKRRDWPFPPYGMHRADVMRRYIEHLEAKSDWDAQPVGYTNEGYKGMQYANAEAYKGIRPDFIERNKLTAPLFAHPAPAVVRQLVEALEDSEHYIVLDLARHDEAYDRHPSGERERSQIVQDLEKLRAALAKATGGSND